jgi:hypothetical protein
LLARGLVGEGDGEDFRRPRAAERENVCDAGGEHAGLAGAGAGQHQDRAVEGLDRELLLGVQVIEIVPPARAHTKRARGNAAWSGYRRVGRGQFLGLGHQARLSRVQGAKTRHWPVSPES